MSLLIKNARIAQPDGTTLEGDVLCAAGRIERIDTQIDTTAQETIDASGHLLLPGVIDPQVHFRDPGHPQKEDLSSGSRAAVRGGVTSFLEMPNTSPPTINQAALDDKLARAAKNCVANYGFFIGATPTNVDVLNTASPVCGIKIFMGSSTGDLLVSRDEDLDRIFRTGDRLIAVHAEDEDCIQRHRARLEDHPDPAAHSRARPNECALLATQRALALSKKYERRLHILHLSTREEADLLRADKPDWVSAEVTPNHLLLNTDDYARQGSRVQMNPPIRSAADNERLWQSLHDGVIDIIATDHAPHTLTEKAAPYPACPSGMPGVETSLPVMLTQMQAGRCTLAQIQRWMCYGPARLYGIANKGQLLEGWDADLTLVDLTSAHPARDEDMFTRVRWTPWVGQKLTGWPRLTVVGGRVVYEHGVIRPGIYGRALTFT